MTGSLREAVKDRLAAGIREGRHPDYGRYLEYNPHNGVFIWKPRVPEDFEVPIAYMTMEQQANRWNSRYAGKQTFLVVNGHGYSKSSLFGLQILAHRVAWIMTYGQAPDQIDHVNGDRTDNRIANLRSVSVAENNRNMRISARNKSGVVGVAWVERRQKWKALIKHDKRTHWLGSFDCFEDAVSARKEAEARYGFHPNHGNAMIAAAPDALKGEG